MRARFRITLMVLLTGAAIALMAPAAAQAAFGIESWFAANCKVSTCKAAATHEEELENAKKEGFTQAAGHPPFGITDFTVANKKVGAALVPEGKVSHIRVDVAPGLSTSPEAAGKCSEAEFGIEVAEGVFTPPACKENTIIGKNEVLVVVEPAPGVFLNVPLTGTVYNLVQKEGRVSTFGVALELPEFITKTKGLFAHTLIEGGVEWGKEAAGTGAADFHDFFEINVSTKLPLVKSRLVFEGTKGGFFITNPSVCGPPGRNTTTRLTLTEEGGAIAPPKNYETPIGLDGCGEVPFGPSFTLTPETTQSDAADGITATLSLPHPPEGIDTSELRTAEATLPEGLTMNPAAAAGLEACTPAQAKLGVSSLGSGCPTKSKLGTVTLEVPQLPPGSLTGNIYLGGPEGGGPITSPPYTIYVDAESARYGVAVRLKGSVVPNESTGRLTTTFADNPEQPFTSIALHFNREALGPQPLANPLTCGPASAGTTLVPYSGNAAAHPVGTFTVDANGKGGGCPSLPPLAPAQNTENQVGSAGAHTSFTFNLERGEGQQYLAKLSTTLPPGLVGVVPAVGQCSEAQALANACPESSLIGNVAALAGSGPTPYRFPGKVYFMGPTKGAPFGMAFVIPEVAGPFNLGTVITLATVNVNPESARVVVSAEPPLIVHGGIPVRMRKLSVSVTRSGFLLNPTNCGVLATETLVTGSSGTTVLASSPFQVSGCDKLAFKPSFKAAATSRTSKRNGASLETTLNLPGGSANVKSVQVTLPKALPSRLTTLQKACPEATFKANPFACPEGSKVGSVRANTPVLKTKMTGPAYLVSHGGAAFPDLDLILQAEGVTVILVGNTDIKNGITKTTFASTPDVPVSSITVNLPTGPHSALAGLGDFCTTPLVMPTTITGQNGVVVKQNTKIRPTDCGVRIVGHKVVGNSVFLSVRTFNAGRISGSGRGLRTAVNRVNGAVLSAKLKLSLSAAGLRHRPHRVRVRVGFVPKNRHLPSSVAFITVRF